MDVVALAEVWETVGLELGITRGRLIVIRAQNQNDPLKCARAVLAALPTVNVDALRHLPRAVEAAQERLRNPAPSAPPPSAPPAVSPPSNEVPPPYSEVMAQLNFCDTPGPKGQP